jgi:alanine racemase
VTQLVRAIVDTRALQKNLQTVRRLAPRSRVMAVVKANAYGHGLVPTALALADADGFAVARLEEGTALRRAGLRHPILLLEGVLDAAQLNEAAHQDFDLVVHSADQIELLARYPGSYRFRVWVKLDTGMNRLGFRLEEFKDAWRRITGLASVAPGVRAMTHLSNADLREDPKTSGQLVAFREAIVGLGSGLPIETSIANSAGLLGWPESHGDWIRPGLLLYGISPIPGACGKDLGLVPAMTLVTRVIAVREVKAGESVGYASAWTAQRSTRIAIAAAGYGDGYPRNVPSGTAVLINGRRSPLVGRVSMDMIAVDVTDGPPPKVGDEVILWGPGLPVEEIAAQAGTIPYELICGVSQRVLHEVM